MALSPALDVTYLLQNLVPGQVNRPSEVIRRAGGKAFNVARVARALGGGPIVLGPVAGATGDAIAAAALREGLQFLKVAALQHESRTCISICTEDGTEPIEINEPTPPIGKAMFGLIAQVSENPSPTTVISGSLPPDVTAEDLTALATAARPGVIAIDIHGPGARTWLGQAPDLDILKINQAEACDLLRCAAPENQAEANELARAVQALCGADLVIVTQGAQGSIARTEHETGLISATARGPHPVGSGDAFMAGLLVKLPPPPWSLADGAVQESLRWAAAAAGVNAQHFGAGSVSQAEVAALVGSVRCTLLV